MDLTNIFNKISFVERYQTICKEHNDLGTSMQGSNREKFDSIFVKLGYNAKYYANGSFYKISDNSVEYEFNLHLVLKDGLVETLIYIKHLGKDLNPKGRFDFIPEKMGVAFDREKFNLPKYSTFEELEIILRSLFSIYEDIKSELINE